MEGPIISVEGLWKQYRLGDVNATSLKEEIYHFYRKHVVKNNNNDPIEMIADNEMEADSASHRFWALKDINFQLQPGEVLGIIGKNGAGKSTLLKLLSRITRPTRGAIRGYGKVASLLEVGTGFHEELTGRENIFLNGNILGMSNNEIKTKLNQIIEFSGISRFIDTPVKRYSSGMYVRLAFAVAAHMNPDILILDEVLAVGDSEFQEKSLRKIKEISKHTGCTIIYVSHNIPTIQELCQRVLLLKEGKIAGEGSPRDIIDKYYKLIGKRNFSHQWDHVNDAPGNELIKLRLIKLQPEWQQPDKCIDVRTPLHLHFEFINYVPEINLSIGIHLFTAMDECIFYVRSGSREVGKGEYECDFTIPGNFLNEGDYYISIIFIKDTASQIFYLEKGVTFDVKDYRGDIKWQGKWMGAVRPAFPVIFHPKNQFINKS